MSLTTVSHQLNGQDEKPIAALHVCYNMGNHSLRDNPVPVICDNYHLGKKKNTWQFLANFNDT